MRRQLILWIFASALLPGLASAQHALQFKTRRFTPPAPQSTGREVSDVDSPVAAGRGHLILGFDSRPTRALATELEARGVHVLGDVPENGLLVSLERRANLRGLGVVSQLSLDPRDKVSPLISTGHASTRRGFLIVEFHPDADMDRGRADLVNLGVEVREHPDLLAHHLLIHVPPGGVGNMTARVAALENVSYVFPASDALADGKPSAGYAGALTENGITAQLIATQGEGWDGPGLGAAALGYFFQANTAQLGVGAQQSEILRAMTEWSNYVKVTWSQAASATSLRTVTVLFATGSHGDATPFDGKGGVLAHTYYPSPPNSESTAGDMHFDDAETWRIGADTDLYSVALHELGHALGLDHADDPSAVMYPYYHPVSGLASLDIASIQALYAPTGATPPPPPPPTSSLKVSLNSPPATTAASSVTLTGSASGGSGAVSITWSSSSGDTGFASGPASGFVIANFPLAVGSNTITVWATDNAKTVSTQAVIIRQSGPTVDSLLGSMPHIASGGGVISSVALLNTTSSPVRDQLQFFGEDGSPLTLTATLPQTGESSGISQLDRIIPSRAMLLIDTANANGPQTVGSARVTGDQPVSGYSLFRVTTTGQEAMVPLEKRLASSYYLPFDNTNGLVTGVAVSNVNTEAATVTVILRDDNGNGIGGGTLNLAALGHDSFVLTARYAATVNRRGTMEFVTPVGGRIGVLGLRFTSSGAFTTIPVLASGSAAGGTLSHFASGGGVKSTIVLVNTGSSTAQASLAFLGDTGSPLSVSLTFPQTGSTAFTSSLNRVIPANAMVVVESQGLPSTQLVGSVRLTGVGAVSGYIIFGTTANGQEAVVPLEDRASNSFVLPFDNTAGLVTGLAAANPSPLAVNVTVTMRDDLGASLGTSALSLPANGHTSFVLTDRLAATANKRGTLEFSTPSAGQISVLGLRFTQGGALTSIPVFVP
ncbi:MAG: matrixin family metalloprotease [Bryobacteraceae bacterium]